MPVIENRSRTGHVVAACTAQVGDRWHWTYGNGQTLCGKPAQHMFDRALEAHLDYGRECKLCRRSLA